MDNKTTGGDGQRIAIYSPQKGWYRGSKLWRWTRFPSFASWMDNSLKSMGLGDSFPPYPSGEGFMYAFLLADLEDRYPGATFQYVTTQLPEPKTKLEKSGFALRKFGEMTYVDAPRIPNYPIIYE